MRGRFPPAASALVLGLAATPYVLNAIATPGGQIFGGAVCLPYDRNVYVALIEQGQRGALRLNDPFTTEPHRSFVRPLWSLVGACSRPFGLSASNAYLASGALLAAFFLWILWRFLLRLPVSTNTRQLAFLLVPLGSGIGWILSSERIESLRRIYQIVAPDRMDVESSVFLSLLAYPQAAATMALMLALLASVASSLDSPRWLPRIGAGAAALAIGFVHPHDLVTLAGALGVWIALEWRAGRNPRSSAAACIAPAAAAAVALAYHADTYAADAVYRETFGVATLTPHPFSYVIAFLPAILLAPFGVSWALSGGPFPRMLLAWAVAVPFLLYLPIPTQRRVIVGYAIPLYVLAAAGLPRALHASRRLLPALSPDRMPETSPCSPRCPRNPFCPPRNTVRTPQPTAPSPGSPITAARAPRCSVRFASATARRASAAPASSPAIRPAPCAWRKSSRPSARILIPQRPPRTEAIS